MLVLYMPIVLVLILFHYLDLIVDNEQNSVCLVKPLKEKREGCVVITAQLSV